MVDLKQKNLEYLDSIDDLGPLLLGSRLKRVTDTLFKQVQDLYDKRKRKFKPNWFSLLLTLYKHGEMDLKTLAEYRQITASAITQILKEIEENNFVEFKSNPSDKRSKLVSITESGLEALLSIVPQLQILEDSITAILGEDLDLVLNKLETLVDTLNKKPFTKRHKASLKCETYSDKYEQDFVDLTKAWFDPMFERTEYDNLQINKPKETIVDKGGEILMLLDEDLVVGAVAMVHHSESIVEISKMAVKEEYKGLGLGDVLMEEAISYAKCHCYKEVTLCTNSVLKPAVKLYRKHNFEQMPKPKSSKYGERADMEFKLQL